MNTITCCKYSAGFLLFVVILSGSEWYLSQNGHDAAECGRNNVTACKTLVYLLERFYNTSHENMTLMLFTDSDLILDYKLKVSVKRTTFTAQMLSFLFHLDYIKKHLGQILLLKVSIISPYLMDTFSVLILIIKQ